MSDDDWEQIHYHQLPDWMKKIAPPGQRNDKTHTKIFSGKPYDYKVQYTVQKDIVSISYWRTAHSAKPLKIPNPRLIVVLIFIFVAGISYVLLPQLLPFIVGPLDSPPSLTNASEIHEMGKTPVQTENLTPDGEAVPGTDFQLSPKTSSYSYIIENNRKFISFTVYGGLSDYFSDERHSSLSGPEKDVISDLLGNDYQDEYLKPFIESIRSRSQNSDDHAKIAISLVQHIPYNRNKPYNTSSGWFYPYETMFSNGGTSADKSLLSAFLLKELGYDTVLFEYPGHMAVGVKCSQDYDFYDTGYAFIETTKPTIITYVPDTYYGGDSVSASPQVIRINEGKRVLDVSSEYRDATRLKQLERMAGVLDQSQYTEWLKITSKYDLQ
ncbi:MAG: hypothetical protein M0Q91_13050 [Methanoregula sp.]|jgi:hypothetical protein|nr:hypothetical protein [Methanoregula sp.]